MEDTSEVIISVEEGYNIIAEWAKAQNLPEECLESVRDLQKMRRKVARNLRDSIFTHLFRRKEYVLELYKALHPDDTSVTLADIRIITIENVVGNGIHNDLGFSVRDQLFVLVEAQTKWSENIVLRELQYLLDTWSRYLWETKQDLYQAHPVRLPEPELYALFPEIKRGPAKLTLANVYFPGKGSLAVDCSVNCIYSHAAKSRTILGQYVRCAQIVAEELHAHGATVEAVEAILRRCKEEHILDEFMEEIRGELLNIFDTISEAERQEHLLEAIKNEGIEQGIELGSEKRAKTGALNLLRLRRLSQEEIAAAMNLSVEEVHEIAKTAGL